MTIREMQQRKRELGYSNEQIAQQSGVPLGTVMKIFSGATKSPRYMTVLALEAFFSKMAADSLSVPDAPVSYGSSVSGAGSLGEAPAAYGNNALPRLYTVEDYYALPDDRRVELIDGVIYDMASPSYVHQGILGEMYVQLKECERSHPGSCHVFLSPCDVQLDCDNYTMVQPDIIVICDRQKQRHQVCYGAPDLAIEILSPSSRSHDCIRKLYKYKKAGVREYWIVDPDNRKVYTYVFHDEEGSDQETCSAWSFSDQIPVFISGGECSIDFARIGRYLEEIS